MSNKKNVLEILSDYKPHSTFEIMDRLYPSGKAGLFRLAAYVGFLKDDGHDIDGWFDGDDHKKYWYQLRPPRVFRNDFFEDQKDPMYT